MTKEPQYVPFICLKCNKPCFEYEVDGIYACLRCKLFFSIEYDDNNDLMVEIKKLNVEGEVLLK